MDVGHLPVFVGPGATPPDDTAAFTAPVGDAAERGFVSALADALGEDDEVPEAARSRGGGAIPLLPTGHALPPEPGWPLLAAVFGPPGGDLESLEGPAASVGDEATGPEGDVPDSPAGAAVTPAGQPLSGSINSLLAAPGPADNGTPARGEADALPPGLDQLLSYPSSDQRSPQGRRAATGQPVAEPEPAGDVGDHGPLADAGRADDGKLMSRALFGGAEQGEPPTQGAEGDGRTPRAFQALPRAPGTSVMDETTRPLPATPAPGSMPSVTASPGVFSPAGAGMSHGAPADPAALSLQASRLATLANRGPLAPANPSGTDPSVRGQGSLGVPPEAATSLSLAATPDPELQAPVAWPPQGAPAPIAPPTIGARGAYPAGPLPEFPAAEQWADELAQQVAVAGRVLPGVSPRSASDAASGGQDGSPGRQTFGRSLADSAALSLAAFGRQSAAEFAAAMSRQPGAPAGLDQAAAEPTADGQPLAHAIVRSLSVQVRQGGGEARLRLQPEYLGELSVSLRVQASSVTVVLRSESPIVRGWIESHQADLRRALEAQGLVLDRIVVDPDADPRQSNHESSPDAQSQPRRRRSLEPGRFEALL